MPYEPSDGMPIETQSPSAVPSAQVRMWSIGSRSGRGSRRSAACLDDRRAALLHGRDEVAPRTRPGRPGDSAALPLTVAWCRSGYWVELWLPQIVIFLMSVVVRAGLLGQLRQRAVVVEAHHRGEALRVEIRSILLRDQRIGVGRIADHQHAHVALGVSVQCLALRRRRWRRSLPADPCAPCPGRADAHRRAGRSRHP